MVQQVRWRSTVAGVIVVATMLAGCSGDQVAPSPQPTSATASTSATVSTPDPTDTAAQLPPVPVTVTASDVAATPLSEAVIATDVLPDGTLLMIDEDGRLWHLGNGQTRALPGADTSPIPQALADARAAIAQAQRAADAGDEANTDTSTDGDTNEQGDDPSEGEPALSAGDVAQVLDLIVAAGEPGADGDSEQPAVAYVSWTTGATTTVTRFTLDLRSTPPVVTDATPLIAALPAGQGINGGALGVGPDGFLYVSVGDAGAPARAQELTALEGKILRYRRDGQIPATNPLPDSPLWSAGHHNVTAIDWASNGRMYAVEQGGHHADELNLINAGANYGWPWEEGDTPIDVNDLDLATTDGGLTLPQGATFSPPLVQWPWSATKQTVGDPQCLSAGDRAVVVCGSVSERAWWIPLPDDVAATQLTAQPLLTGQYGPLIDAHLDATNSTLTVVSSTASPPPGGATAPHDLAGITPDSTTPQVITMTLTPDTDTTTTTEPIE